MLLSLMTLQPTWWKNSGRAILHNFAGASHFTHSKIQSPALRPCMWSSSWCLWLSSVTHELVYPTPATLSAVLECSMSSILKASALLPRFLFLDMQRNNPFLINIVFAQRPLLRGLPSSYKMALLSLMKNLGIVSKFF